MNIPVLPLTIKPDESINLEIEFEPTEEKNYTAIFTIGSNAYNESDLHIKLTGNGETRKPQIHIEIASFLFGNIAIGETREKTMNVKNAGTGELIINNITFEEPFQNVYLFKDFTLPINIAALGERNMTFEFAPKEAISYKTKIFIHSNSLTDSVFTVQFMGTGREGTGIEDLIASDEFIVVHPNPATNFSIITISPEVLIQSIRIVDLLGNEIVRYDSNRIQNNIIEIDTKSYHGGTYLIQAVTESELRTYKLIVN